MLHSVEITEIYSQCGKNDNFSLTEKKIRQINYLVISLVKPLLSRNFCQKRVFRNFHAALWVWDHSVEITEILYHTFLTKIS